LQIAAVAYLKKLDELHDERGARLAADQTLAKCLEDRRAQADTLRSSLRKFPKNCPSSRLHS
jgi:hypothetical protein